MFKQPINQDLKKFCAACQQAVSQCQCARSPDQQASLNASQNPIAAVVHSVNTELQQHLQGRYEIEKKLFQGGMGQIYLARHLALNKPVAIKVLRNDMSANQSAFLRFDREAKAASDLRHPGLVQVSDYGMMPSGSPFLVMDFVEGETLADLLERKGVLDQNEALDLFIGICDALFYAHKKGVLHRDIKPGNIIIAQTLDGARPIIVDFGIARLLDNEAGQNITATGECMGTPLYMSPEQCQGDELDQRSDIYALGCVMYEVLNGIPPFVGTSAFKTLRMHVEDPCPPFQNLSVSKGLIEVINHCLAKDKFERYSSVAEVEDDLERVRKGSPVGKPVRAASRAWLSLTKTFLIVVLFAFASFVIYVLINPKVELKSSQNGKVEYVAKARGLSEAVSQACQQKVHLEYLDLKNARLDHLDARSGWIVFSDFSNADLSYAKLSSANLNGDKFHEAKIYFADLQKADLINADFSSAYLQHCNFRDACFGQYVKFSNADLRDADFERAQMDFPTFTDSKLEGAILKNVHFGCADFRGVHLDNQDLSGSEFASPNFVGAILPSANLSKTELNYANFQGAQMDHVNLQHAQLHDAKFRDAILMQADLSGTDLSNADFSNADLKGADLRGAKLAGTKFHGAKLTDAKLDHPISTN